MNFLMWATGPEDGRGIRASEGVEILNKTPLVLLQGVRHGGPQFETEENLVTVFTFLDKSLK